MAKDTARHSLAFKMNLLRRLCGRARVPKHAGQRSGDLVGYSHGALETSDTDPSTTYPQDVHQWDSAIPSPISPQNPMRLLAFLGLLTLVLHEAGTASLPGERKREEQSPEEGDTYAFLHVGNYALSLEDYSDVIDLSNYEEPADYGDQTPEVKGHS